MTSPFHSIRGAFSWLCALSLLPFACSSTPATSGDPDGGTPDGGNVGGGPADGGEPDAATEHSKILIGSFLVRATSPIPASGGVPETPGHTSVFGKVYDGPSPSALIWEAKTKEGDCQLFTPRVPFCNTPCGGSAVCVEDDVCEPYPLAHSAGTVTLKGLVTEAGQGDIVMKPIANGYQPPAGTKLLYPAFAEGDAIVFQASGDYFAAFTLQTQGVSPLEILNDTLPLDPNKPFQIDWKPPKTSSIAKVHVKLDISHHGGTKGMIECNAPDTGAVVISAGLVTELLNLGVSGYPTVIVTRKATGSVTLQEGRINAVVSSAVERSVQIAGITSCTSNDDCTAPQICQNDLKCQ